MSRKSLALGAGSVVLGALLLVSLAWGLQHAALANPPILGRTAPQLAIKTLAGDQVSMTSLRGKPVVVNFWASWCGPCVQEGGVLSQAAQSRPDVAFVGADNRDTAAGFQSFEAEHPHPYPAGPIVEGSYQAYGVAGLPATFFVNSDGVVVASFVGPLDSATLNHYLDLIAR